MARTNDSKTITIGLATPWQLIATDDAPGQIAHFADASTVRVFEYYSDAILFKSMLPVMSNIMQQDLRFYHAAGVHTIQTLMTGDRP